MSGIKKRLRAAVYQHDTMEFTTNDQFSLSDELVSIASDLLAERNLLLVVVEAAEKECLIEKALGYVTDSNSNLDLCRDIRRCAIDAYHASKEDGNESSLSPQSQQIREGKVSKGGRNDPPIRPRPTGRPQAEPVVLRVASDVAGVAAALRDITFAEVVEHPAGILAELAALADKLEQKP